MESNMKKIFQYMTTLLLLLVVGTSCEEGNDNWRIITDAQPGAYITGDATIYIIVLRLHRPNWWLHRWMELRKVQM